MANSLYDKARQRALTTGMNLSAGDIKLLLIDTAEYTFDAAHEFRSSIPGAAIVATSTVLTTKSVTDGVFDADDVTFTSLTGASIEAVILIRDTGNAATDELILYIDEGNFPVTPNGGDQTFVWSNDVNKIFRV